MVAAAACRQAFTFMGSLRKLLPPFLGLCLVSLRSNFPDETLMWPKIVIDLNKFIRWDPFYSQEQGQRGQMPRSTTLYPSHGTGPLTGPRPRLVTSKPQHSSWLCRCVRGACATFLCARALNLLFRLAQHSYPLSHPPSPGLLIVSRCLRNPWPHAFQASVLSLNHIPTPVQ